MQHSRRILLFSACVVFSLATQAYAANKTIADATAKPEKVAKQVWFGPAPGQIKKLYDIGMPKRVGLISFYVFDTGAHEYSVFAGIRGPSLLKKWGGNEFIANISASILAGMSVPVIKQRFAEKGIEILTPVEFLDTEKKATAYFSFELPKSALQKATESAQQWLDRNPHAAGRAVGYRMIPLHSSFLGKEVMGELDEFRKSLELDALMVVTAHTASDKVGQRLTAVTMQLAGPNPEPRPEIEKHVKWWSPMEVYTYANFGKGFKGAQFNVFETKKKPSWTSYEGFDVIIDAMATRTLAELQKHYDKGAKKAKK